MISDKINLHYHPGLASLTSQFDVLRYTKQIEPHHWSELELDVACLPMRRWSVEIIQGNFAGFFSKPIKYRES